MLEADLFMIFLKRLNQSDFQYMVTGSVAVLLSRRQFYNIFDTEDTDIAEGVIRGGTDK